MIITVSQLGNFLKALVDNEPMLSGVSVRGEVSCLRGGGEAVYFVLKDENAQVDCFWYAQAPFKFRDGDKVVVTGKPNYYLKGGKLSFHVTSVKELNEKGFKHMEFLLLKDKLEKEGIFDVSTKKPVTRFAQKIGVVTSAGGAVIHDIETVVRRRNPSADIFLYDVKVQGTQSAKMLVSGLDYFCTADADVVIVGRGGGSDEDLSAFNDEAVVRAVKRCLKPVISAVGHETDYTLCDLAADLRAATPSAAAEICTADIGAWKRETERRLFGCLESAVNKLDSDAKLLGLVSKNFTRVFDGILETSNSIVSDFCQRLTAVSEIKFNERLNRLKLVASAVEQNNPLRLLANGYSALFSEAGERINSVGQVEAGQEIYAYLSDGKVTSKVLRKEKK